MEFRKQGPIYKRTIVNGDKSKEILLYRNEEVKKLEEYPNYHFTSEGRVYSWYVNRFLEPDDNIGKKKRGEGKKSYIQYHLINKDGENKKVYAHILVWQAFGNCPIPKDYEIHHINGESTDNSIENLKLVTKAEHDLLDGKIEIGIETKVTDANTFDRKGLSFPNTYMKRFTKLADAAAYLNMDEKEFSKLIDSEPEKTFGDTGAWHAPDGRMVLKFKKHYSSKDDYLYFKE